MARAGVGLTKALSIEDNADWHSDLLTARSWTGRAHKDELLAALANPASTSATGPPPAPRSRSEAQSSAQARISFSLFVSAAVRAVTAAVTSSLLPEAMALQKAACASATAWSFSAPSST